MPRLNARGAIVQLLLILLLVVGLIAAVYLVQKTQIFKPKATLSGTRIEFVGANIISGKAVSRDVELAIYYEPAVTTSSSVLPTPELLVPSATPSATFESQPHEEVDRIPPTPSPTPTAPPAPSYITPTGIGSTASIGVGGSIKGVGTTAPQTDNFPTHFRVANSQGELATATEQVFDMNGKVIDWLLTSGNGQKTVYVQFKIDGIWSEIYSANIQLEQTIPSPSPTPNAVACTVCGADINKDGAVTILDFSKISVCFNKKATDEVNGKPCTDADINKDGVITILDQSCLSSNFNKICPEHTQATPIPTSVPTPSPTATPTPSPTPSPTPTPAPTIIPTIVPTPSPIASQPPLFEKGDTNQDKQINFSDLSFLISKIGTKSDFKGADVDKNGAVDETDLNELKSILTQKGVLGL